MMNYREEMARRHGYRTFAELLDISDPLPLTPGEKAQSYVARRPDGTWFVWEDAPSPGGLESNRGERHK